MSQPIWKTVCNKQDLVINSGVVVWLDGVQVALFYLPTSGDETLYAIDNHDPQSGANVIGRGLIGSIKGDLVVAAPIYKQHYRLHDGQCLETPHQRLRVWPVRLMAGVVEVAVTRADAPDIEAWAKGSNVHGAISTVEMVGTD